MLHVNSLEPVLLKLQKYTFRDKTCRLTSPLSKTARTWAKMFNNLFHKVKVEHISQIIPASENGGSIQYGIGLRTIYYGMN